MSEPEEDNGAPKGFAGLRSLASKIDVGGENGPQPEAKSKEMTADPGGTGPLNEDVRKSPPPPPSAPRSQQPVSGQGDTSNSSVAKKWLLAAVCIGGAIWWFGENAGATRMTQGASGTQTRLSALPPVSSTPTTQQARIETVYLDLIDSEWVRGLDGRDTTFRVLVRNSSRFTVGTPEISAKMEPCNSNSYLVRAAQQELNRLGFNAGAVDGLIGSRTRNAIANFQTSRGLSVSRELDSATTRALGISRSVESFPSFGAGFIVGGYEIPPGRVAYVDFINFYGQTRGREFCYRVSRNVRVLQN